MKSSQLGFEIIIRLKGVPPKGTDTNFKVALANQDGPIKREGEWVALGFSRDPNGRLRSMFEPSEIGESTFVLFAPGKEPLPDGPYRGIISIGEVKVAVLNWSVGAR